MTPTFVLYTYATLDGETVCHAYGLGEQVALQNLGQELAAQTPGLGFMVLALEAVPS